jgi:hypothetical protein
MCPTERTVLVFPPQASPTYVPLGLASLLAHVRREAPSCAIRALDLNLGAWEWAAGQHPAGEACLRFSRGRGDHGAGAGGGDGAGDGAGGGAGRGAGDFYDPAAYSAQRAVLGELEAILDGAADRLRRWLATGEPDDGLLSLLDAQIREIFASEPTLVGFSILSFSQLPWALALAARLRGVDPMSRLRAPPRFGEGGEGAGTGRGAGRPAGAGARAGEWAPRVVLGGAACSALEIDDLLRACPFVEGVVVGEGEAGLLALCQGRERQDVPALRWRDGETVRRNPRARPAPMETLPFPDWSDFDLERVLCPRPVLPVIQSRGCRWRRCGFCAHGLSFSGHRTRAARDMADELEALVEQRGAHHFYFADLYLEAEDLEHLADELMRRELGIHYHVLGRPTAAYTPARLEKLAASGCRWVSWGVESGSQRLLDLVRKGTRVPEVAQVLRDARGAGISNLMMMIFGLPTSRDDDLQATFRFIESVYDDVDAMTACPFQLYEGTPFARRADALGLMVDEQPTLLRVGAHPVRSRQLLFRERARDGGSRPPRGPLEADQWRQRRRWLGEVPFLESMLCEHYLLHVSRRVPVTRRTPQGPRRTPQGPRRAPRGPRRQAA